MEAIGLWLGILRSTPNNQLSSGFLTEVLRDWKVYEQHESLNTKAEFLTAIKAEFLE